MSQAIPLQRVAADAESLGWRDRLAGLDLVPDLGDNIGSAEWWRGLATLTLLCGTAIASFPGIQPLGVAGTPALDAADFNEARIECDRLRECGIKAWVRDAAGRNLQGSRKRHGGAVVRISFNKMSYEIEKGVPVPHREKKRRYPFADMGAGDSFFVPASRSEWSQHLNTGGKWAAIFLGCLLATGSR